MAKRRNETKIILPQGSTEKLFHHKVRLEVMSGADLGVTATVDKKVLYVGTQPGNSLQLTDETVSGIHLEIKITDRGLLLRDLGSTNGTWVDSVRIFEAVVPSGRVIAVGKTQVRMDALEEQVSVPISRSYRFGHLIGKSKSMRSLFAQLERVAPSDETVLIVGETGTGKEVCALSLVTASLRRNKPLEVVDCGAIPPNLLENELFGHARGSFTGAVADYRGAFERAQGGTIFLDEIGEIPLELQSRLLRAVENRCIRRVGDGREIPLDIRIIAATNRCLEEEVNRGTFRTDLYYRLSVVQLRLPPLRDRREDIEMLSRHLLDELSDGPAMVLSASQIEELARHRWPGNVRELRNYLHRMSLGDNLMPAAPPLGERPGKGVSIELDLSKTFKENKNHATEQFERVYLRQLINEAEGNISKAARMAKTDRTYLSKLLSKYKISMS